MRRSGILMHISSLPGPGGIGSLGKEAYAFADFLKASGMAVWQVLPLGPTGYGESPYQSSSVFAGNPMLISCAALREAGLVTYDDGEEFTPDDPERVDYPAVRESKEKLLRRCFAQSEGKLQKELADFRRENPWVEDFALFTALKARYGGVMWTKWPDREVRRRQPAALERCRRELDGEIRYHLFCQYLFFRQWFALKRYCNGLGIRLFGDMPIYVAEDSADTWTRPEVFQLDGEGVPKRVAGVPPDFFSADGQLWGNPLYRWFSPAAARLRLVGGAHGRHGEDVRYCAHRPLHRLRQLLLRAPGRAQRPHGQVDHRPWQEPVPHPGKENPRPEHRG